MPRYFTLPQAEKVLPEVEQYLRDALFHKAEAQKAQKQLEEVAERIRFSGGARIHPGEQVSLRTRRDSNIAALKEAIEQIDQAGAMIKDLDIGLIDFMSRFQDRDVCLCWRLGEDGIRYWHSTEEGFRGRKPIDQEFLDGHSGEAQGSQVN